MNHILCYLSWICQWWRTELPMVIYPWNVTTLKWLLGFCWVFFLLHVWAASWSSLLLSEFNFKEEKAFPRWLRMSFSLVFFSQYPSSCMQFWSLRCVWFQYQNRNKLNLRLIKHSWWMSSIQSDRVFSPGDILSSSQVCKGIQCRT